MSKKRFTIFSLFFPLRSWSWLMPSIASWKFRLQILWSVFALLTSVESAPNPIDRRDVPWRPHCLWTSHPRAWTIVSLSHSPQLWFILHTDTTVGFLKVSESCFSQKKINQHVKFFFKTKTTLYPFSVAFGIIQNSLPVYTFLPQW